MGMTITEKILASHSGRSTASVGQNVWCDVDVLMINDVTGPGAIGVFHEHFGPDGKVFDGERVVIIADHYIFTADPKAHRNVDILRDFARRQGIRHYYDADFMVSGAQGIPAPYADPRKTSYRGVCHLALPQGGHTRPGEVLLGADSHTCTHGAFGEFATGIGNTEAAFVMGTGKLWLKVPPTLRFVFHGAMPEYLMAKDLILHVIGEIGTDGAAYCAMEFAGAAIAGLNMEERMTLCNMAVEAGAKNGIIAPDQVTLEYVRSKTKEPFEVCLSDADSSYAKVYEFDAGALEPTVKAETYVVPATVEVDMDLDRLKVAGKTLRAIFQEAGCKIGPPSCAACLGGPPDTFGRVNEPLKVVSTTNRNFPGRMGHKQAEIYLASPLTAAATAVTGKVTDPREFLR